MRLILFFMSLIVSQAQGSFSRGALFEYSNLSGQLIIQCPQTKVQTTCSQIHLEPWPYDVYSGPRLSGATQVELLATVNDNPEIRRALAAYNGQTGVSKEINLGVSALFQKPLLRFGQNTISALVKDRRNQVLSESSFEISVTRGVSRTCQARMVNSNLDSDCSSPYSVCQQYFVDQKYCR